MSTGQGQYSIGLDKTPANFVPLSPVSFLERTASVYPGRVGTVYEDRVFTWAQTYERCKRLASWLARHGIGRGDTVAAMLPNIPAMNELHFAVPMAAASSTHSTSVSTRPPSLSCWSMAARKSCWLIPNSAP